MEDPDDADDVDWEGDGSDEDIGDAEGEVCEEQAINIAIRVGPESANGKKSKNAAKVNPVKRVIFTEEDYDICTQRCHDCMDETLTLGLVHAHAAANELVRANLLEIVPDTLAPLEQYKRRFDQWIAHIRWMKDTFRVVSTKDMTVEEGRDGSFSSDLVHFVLKNSAGSSHQLTQLFAALMLNLGYRVRLVSTVDLVSCSPQEHPDLYKARWTAAQGENCTIPFKDRKYAKLGEKHSWLEVLYEPVSATARCTKPPVRVDLDAVVDLTDDTDLPAPVPTNITTATNATNTTTTTTTTTTTNGNTNITTTLTTTTTTTFLPLLLGVTLHTIAIQCTIVRIKLNTVIERANVNTRHLSALAHHTGVFVHRIPRVVMHDYSVWRCTDGTSVISGARQARAGHYLAQFALKQNTLGAQLGHMRGPRG